ncbi:MAG: hypothetical protein MUF23_16665 [Pirellula sp.]|jgi:uncharacterized membrane protein|nr:hypothetical protein [Pirellula sp.]
MLHRSFTTSFGRVGTIATLVAFFCCQLWLHGQETETDSSKVTAPAKLVDFARDVAPILQSRCAECHEGEKAKNDFVIGDREAVMGFITEGSAADSSLWTDYLVAPKGTSAEPSLLMPPDGPLPAHELAVLKLWMDEGASWPEGATLTGSPTPSPAAESTASSPNWFRAIGYLHPAFVHFPIALLLMAAASAVTSYLLGDRYAQFAYSCLVLGFLFAIATAVMGWSFAEARGYSDWSKMITAKATEDESNIFFHRWLGLATVLVGLIVVVAGWKARQPDGTRPGHLWRIGTLLLAMLVATVGHQGGELVYGDLLAKAMEQLSK